MKTLRSVLLLVLIALGAVQSVAQTWVAGASSGSYFMYAEIEPGSGTWPVAPAKKKLTGTSGFFRLDFGVGGPPGGNSCNPTEVYLTVGNESLELPPVSPISGRYDVQFATNHFANGTVRITFTVHFISTVGGVETEYVLSPYVDVDIVNKAIVTGTDDNGNVQQILPEWPTFSTMSKEEANAAALYLSNQSGSNALRHIVEIGDGSLVSTEILPLLNDCTLFFASTHGTEEGIDDGGNPRTFMEWDEINQSAGESRELPWYHMAIIYGCWTYTSQHHAANAFGIPGGTNSRNQSHVGFDWRVINFLVPDDRSAELPALAFMDLSTDPYQPKGMLKQHVNRLFSKLASGVTINNALNSQSGTAGANWSYPPRTTANSSGKYELLNMKIDGDPLARIGSVYRTATEEAAFPGDTRWYFVTQS